MRVLVQSSPATRRAAPATAAPVADTRPQARQGRSCVCWDIQCNSVLFGVRCEHLSFSANRLLRHLLAFAGGGARLPVHARSRVLAPR